MLKVRDTGGIVLRLVGVTHCKVLIQIKKNPQPHVLNDVHNYYAY